MEGGAQSKSALEAYLLDTHIILWLTTDDKQLTETTKEIIQQGHCFVSTVSLWEVAIKFSIGKLKLEGGLTAFLDVVKDLDFERIDIEDAHLNSIEGLPKFENHKAPFDRLLIAQAINERLTVITHDENFGLYDVKRLK
jgi:PIN domain nuclease of toxin-antitoxin system